MATANKASNLYLSHSSLANHHPTYHSSQKSQQNVSTKNQQPTTTNASLLSFNKQKRSSSIDNVISSLASSSQPFNKIYSTNKTNETTNAATTTNNSNKSRPSNLKSSNSNLFLSGTDLKDLLESFNINTSKLTSVNDRSSNNFDDSQQQQQHANRSRSLHRDSSNGHNSSYYMDLNQRRKLLNDTSRTPSTNDNIHFTSALNSASVISAHRPSQYEILNQQSQFDESSQNVLYNSSDLNSSSHVPKPPPGNPHRNTNLYPAAR